jgi:hypothetical protein
MTDRLKGCVVSFANDIRVDDAESIINAIKMIKGVIGVEVNISDVDDYMNRSKVRRELEEKVWKALHEERK